MRPAGTWRGVMVRQPRAPSPVQARRVLVSAQPLDGVTSWAMGTLVSASPISGGATGKRAAAACGPVVDAAVAAGAVVGGTAVVGGEGGTVTAG